MVSLHQTKEGATEWAKNNLEGCEQVNEDHLVDNIVAGYGRWSEGFCYDIYIERLEVKE